MKQLKESYWKQFTEEKESDLYGSLKKIWKILTKRKVEASETITFNVINIPRCIEYFEMSYKEENDYKPTVNQMKMKK